MKNFILILTMLFGVITTSNAQIQTYKSTELAIAVINQNTGRYDWSDWSKCSVSLVFDLNKDIITIYSKNIQVYHIVDGPQSFTDNSGGKQVKYLIVDQDGARGSLRLRIERNGNSQIYIDFADIAWVYNIYRVS